MTLALTEILASGAMTTAMAVASMSSASLFAAVSAAAIMVELGIISGLSLLIFFLLSGICVMMTSTAEDMTGDIVKWYDKSGKKIWDDLKKKWHKNIEPWLVPIEKWFNDIAADSKQGADTIFNKVKAAF